MRAIVVLFLGLLCGEAALAAELFGSVEAVTGEAYLVNATGGTERITEGLEIFEGQQIESRTDGEVHIISVDGGFYALRPNSRFRVDEYLAEKSAKDKVYLSLLKGALRSVTGWVGKFRKEAYRTVTPTATIGVRGTDHETLVLEHPVGRDDPGTYESVAEGITVLHTDHGEVEVHPGQFAFAARDRAVPPIKLDIPPEALKNRELKIENRIQNRKEALSRAFEQMSEDRVQEIRETFENATPEQRAKMKKRMRRKINRLRD